MCLDVIRLERRTTKYNLSTHVTRLVPVFILETRGLPILSSKFHWKKGSYELLDSSNGVSLLTIRRVELSIGKVHLFENI